MPTKKMKMPKVEVLKDSETANDQPLVHELAQAIEVSVIVVPLGTNHRQVRLAFDVRTNKVQPSDISAIVQTVFKKAAPMVGEKLVEIIGVEKNLLDSTKQK